MATCIAGQWSQCSRTPAAADTCAAGNDDNCNGVPNEGCRCDGFVMSNPASSGLPNAVSYDTSTTGVAIDRVTGLMWERGHSTDTLTQSQAVGRCAGLTLAGLSGWRVPSVAELVSLQNFTASPAIDTTVFDDAIGAWTATPVAGMPATYWVLAFSFGGTYGAAASDQTQFHARCVRNGGPPPARCFPPGARFQAQPGPSIYDAATGLIWQQTATQLTWTAAQTFCPSGWRLPSINELQTIVDYATPSPGPTIDATAFPGTAASNFWSSSQDVLAANNVWCVNFATGESAPQPTPQSGPGGPPARWVRCVR